MIMYQPQIRYEQNQFLELDTLIRTISSAKELQIIDQQVLPELVRITKAHWVGLYAFGNKATAPLFISNGLTEAIANYMERSCSIEFNCYTQYPDAQYSMPAFAAPHVKGSLQYFPLIHDTELTGLLVTESCMCVYSAEQWENFLITFSNKLTDLIK